jgi:hypothetical protein
MKHSFHYLLSQANTVQIPAVRVSHPRRPVAVEVSLQLLEVLPLAVSQVPAAVLVALVALVALEVSEPPTSAS